MIVKIRNKSHFAQINNQTLRDKRLSLEARGALAEILTYSEQFETSVPSLMTLWGIGRRKLLKITNELKEFGYLEIVNVRDGRGQIVDKDWIFYGESQMTDFRDSNKDGTGEPVHDAQNRHHGETENHDAHFANVRTTRSAQNRHHGHIYKDLKRKIYQEEKFKSEEKEREREEQQRPPAQIFPKNEFLEIFKEFFPQTVIRKPQIELVANRIRDGSAWRKAVVYWATNGYRAASVGKICDKYDEILLEGAGGGATNGASQKHKTGGESAAEKRERESNERRQLRRFNRERRARQQSG